MTSRSLNSLFESTRQGHPSADHIKVSLGISLDGKFRETLTTLIFGNDYQWLRMVGVE